VNRSRLSSVNADVAVRSNFLEARNPTQLQTSKNMIVDLSIIIINWKSAVFTRQCLASIRETTSVLKYEVLVVDNASYDGCGEMISREFPEVFFIQSEQNLGFAKANNLAFSRCHGRNVLFLNPDTEVRGAALQKLVASLESIPDAGMVGAHLLNSDGSLQTTCVVALPSILNQVLGAKRVRRAFPRWRIWGMRPLFEASHNPVPVEAISGACMLAKRDVLELIGCFTADYFMYAEDMDLCVKVAKAGWTIYYVPDALITHHAAKSSAAREESNFSSIKIHESVLRFMEIHRGPRYAMMYKVSTAVAAVVRLFLLAIAFPIAVHSKSRGLLFRAISKWFDLLVWATRSKPRPASDPKLSEQAETFPGTAIEPDNA
jgi:N-acetylglucosaminyl-diphospho-decaprenol L-rhamnosyltransferase